MDAHSYPVVVILALLILFITAAAFFAFGWFMNERRWQKLLPLLASEVVPALTEEEARQGWIVVNGHKTPPDSSILSPRHPSSK